VGPPPARTTPRSCWMPVFRSRRKANGGRWHYSLAMGAWVCWGMRLLLKPPKLFVPA